VWGPIGRTVASRGGFVANRPRIIAVTLGRRFGGLGKSQPVGTGRVVNRNEEAGLLGADQLTHKDDSYEDQDNERKKR
jgi:hypothetical protein